MSEVEETQSSMEALEDAFSDPLASISDLDLDAFESSAVGELGRLLDDEVPMAETPDQARRRRERN